MKKTILSIGVLSVMIFTGCKKDLTGRFELQSDIAGQQANNSGLENAGGAFVRNEILVKFKKGTPESGTGKCFCQNFRKSERAYTYRCNEILWRQ